MYALRRYLPPLLILLPLVFVCGKLLLTPVELKLWPVSNQAAVCGGLHPIVVPIGQGWPWVFCEYDSLTYFTKAVTYHYQWLVADLLCFAVAIGFVGFLLMRHYRRRGAWLRFSLRELMVVVGCVTVGLGWLQYHRTQYAREVTTLERMGGQAVVRTTIEYSGPEWLRRLWSHRELKPFHRITRMNIKGDKLAEQHTIALTQALPEFAELHIVDWYVPEVTKGKQPPRQRTGSPIRDCFLCDPSAYSTIRYLGLYDQAIDDDWLAVLDSMPGLRGLGLHGSQITDRGLETILRFSELESLSLSGCRFITDEGVRQLGKLTKLKSLGLPEQISKGVVEQIKQEIGPGLQVVHYWNN
jgi:hypothetical protein